MLQENREAFAQALDKDLAKPKFESYLFEIGGCIERSLKSAAALEEWSKPEDVPGEVFQRNWNIKIHKSAKGPVLVIAYVRYTSLCKHRSHHARKKNADRGTTL